MPSPPAESFETALSAFRFYCESKNLSPLTLEWYARRLAVFTSWAEAKGLTPQTTQTQHLREFIASLAELKPATRNGYLRCLRAFFRHLHNEEYLPTNPAKGTQPQREFREVFPTFTAEQIEALLAACNRKTFTGLREHTLILTLLDTGLRISEALSLRLQDVDLQDGILLVVNGKGRKQRQVPIGSRLKRELWRYLTMRGDIPGQDLVFVTRSGERMDRHNWARDVLRAGRRAGIEGVRVSPHTFRYTFATMWLRSGGDLFTLQRILGHTSLEMVRRYAQQVVTDLQEKHRVHSPMDRLARR